ncbi:MAG: helix-turn-helix domain-containing protein [Thermodesulfobacteriota bacterium]
MDKWDIQAELRRRGITQLDLARQLGVTDMAVSRVISGETVSARIRAAIAAAIGKPVDTLWSPSRRRLKN